MATTTSVGLTDLILSVFREVDQDEISEYRKLFPKLANVADRPIHCTSCNLHIGTAPINEAIIKMHPVLRVIQCKKCYTFYTSGEFERGHDGYEFYCHWCGKGGEVYCCSKCPKVYCRRCVAQNFSKDKVIEIQNNEDWICFACDPACMTQLKADYWAVLNFIEKQKKSIANKRLTEIQLNEAMSKDYSKCCINVIKRLNNKRKLPDSTDSTLPAKRINDWLTLSEPRTIINDALVKEVENKTSVKPEKIKFHCSSKSGSMLSSRDTDLPTNAAIHTPPSTKKLIYAQPETYRLQNGELIQVKKQQVIPNESKIPTPILPQFKPRQTIQINRKLNAPESNQTEPPELQISSASVSQTTNDYGVPSKPTTVMAHSPVDMATIQFQDHLENCIELCQHIIGKMKMLINSTSFKNVKTNTDVKDLYMDLSYLLTYAGSHFKMLHQKCVDDLKVMGFHPDSSDSDDDDVEILEPSTTLIELDSDENEEDDSWRRRRKDVKNLLNVENGETNAPELVEIVVESESLFVQQNAEINIETEATDLNESLYDKPKINNKALVTAVTANGSDLFEIYEIYETANDDKNEKKNSNKDGEKYKDTEETNKSKNDRSDKRNTDQNPEQNTEELPIKSKTTEIDINPMEMKTNDKEYNIRDAARFNCIIKMSSTDKMKRNLLRSFMCPLEIPEKKFTRLFRLSKESFKYILDKITPKFKPMRNINRIPPILKLAATLRFLADGSDQQLVGQDYFVGMAQPTVSKALKEVLNILDSFYDSFINFDQTEEEKTKCKQHYYSKTGFPGIIGCIDGTHVNIIRPTMKEQYFQNKKGHVNINIMATCNHNLLLTSVFANHEGSSSDFPVWWNSLERYFLEAAHSNGDKSSWLLGDSKYPLEPWLMTPYKFTLDDNEVKFNEIHSKCRTTIDKCFAILKGRFRCLLDARGLLYKVEKAAQIINVSCMLHNICVKFNVEFDEALYVNDEKNVDNTIKIKINKLNPTLNTEASRIRDEIKNAL